jgi:hypothetical protein
MNSWVVNPGSRAASPPPPVSRTTRQGASRGSSNNHDSYRRSELPRRKNDDIEYARAATNHYSYRRSELPRRDNDDIEQPRRANYKTYDTFKSVGVGLGQSAGMRRTPMEPRTIGLSLESLNRKKNIQTYLVELSNLTDREQRLAQGIAHVTADGRYVLLSKSECVNFARDNTTDLRSEKYQLLMRQVDRVKAGATAQIAVLELKTEAKIVAVRTKHATTSEHNAVAMAKYADEMYERDAAQMRAERPRLKQQADVSEPSRSTSPVRAARTRAAAADAQDTIAGPPSADNAEDEGAVASPTSSARAPTPPLLQAKGNEEWLTTQLALLREMRTAEVEQINAATDARVMEILARSDMGTYDTIEDMLGATYDLTIVAANTLLHQHWAPGTIKTLMSLAKIAGDSTAETFHKLWKIWQDKARRSDLKQAAIDDDALRYHRPFIGKWFTLEGGLAKLSELEADASANVWTPPARAIPACSRRRRRRGSSFTGTTRSRSRASRMRTTRSHRLPAAHPEYRHDA